MRRTEENARYSSAVGGLGRTTKSAAILPRRWSAANHVGTLVIRRNFRKEVNKIIPLCLAKMIPSVSLRVYKNVNSSLTQRLFSYFFLGPSGNIVIRPCGMPWYSMSHRYCPLDTLPLHHPDRFPRSMQGPSRSLATYMPEASWPVNRFPPTSSRS